MTSMADIPVYMLPGVPVVQPLHLEGLSDPSLSTEILPGPPSLLSVQQAAHKRDPKKPGAVVSYLPASDPGSTYSGLTGSAFSGSEIEGQRRKRARIEKGSANGRAQRASARNMNSNLIPASDSIVPEVSSRQPSIPPIPDSDPFPINADSEEPSVSRATSAPAPDEPLLPQPPLAVASNGRGRPRKDKGKGKEIEKLSVKINEEPVATYSLSPDPPLALLNEDHCSSCRSLGALVYCDGCPRAFHLWCLDPPMEAVELPELGERWYCPSCTIRKHPPPKPPPSFMSPLIHQAQTTMPKEFQLPDDVRNFFKDVSTASNGSYVDNSEVKQPRLNRHGQLEDREPYRLKDKNGIAVLCFRCGTSALSTTVDVSAPPAKRPRRSTSYGHSASPADVGHSIVSCDYCSLHWHLDCLDPPLVAMPPFNKKWMCPNHADHAFQPARRIPKQNPPIVDITQPRQFNNGNIDIIHPQTTSMTEKLVLDEVLINGRRYRVPEKVIMLDFWNKISKDQPLDQRPVVSGMSSPLTSLSSLDDFDEQRASLPEGPPISGDELYAAQLLCNLRRTFSKRPEQRPAPVSNSRKLVDSSTQTEENLPTTDVGSRVEVLRSSTNKRKAPTRSTALGPENGYTAKSSVQAPTDQVRPKRARISVKQEAEEVTLCVPDSLEPQMETQAKSTRTTRQRRKPRPSHKDTAQHESTSLASTQAAAPAPSSTIQPESSEAPALPASSHTVATSPASHPPFIITPRAQVYFTQSADSPMPTLKIRLPRLGAVSAAVHSNPIPPVMAPACAAAAAREPRARRPLQRQTSESATVSLSGTTSSATDGGDEFNKRTNLKCKMKSIFP